MLSGLDTEAAVRLTATQFGGTRWLLGVPGFASVVGRLPGHERCTVALPISVRVWKMWRVRNLAALSTLAAGVTFLAIGVATRTVALAVFGVVVALGAVAYRTRANHDYWVTCTLHPSNATIVVDPTHPRFDDAARDLFRRALR